MTKKTDMMLDALKKLIPIIKNATPDDPILNTDDARYKSIQSFLAEHYPEIANQTTDILVEIENYRQIIVANPEQSLGYPQGKKPVCNLEVYKALLPYTHFLYQIEKNGIAEEHAYKLAVIFNDVPKAFEYIKKFCRDLNTNQPLHDACVFALPQSEINLAVWKKLSEKYLDLNTFRNLLPQAAELEALIKNHEKPKRLLTKEDIKKVIDEIKSLNSIVKKSQKKHGSLSVSDKRMHEDNLKKLFDKQMELTNMGVPFDEMLTDTALMAFRERYNFESSLGYKTFLENGLGKDDYAKFINLNISVNNDEAIPEVIMDGAEINQPGYYLRKIPRGDEAYAALGACLGKLTHCCQSLSGEAGEPCTIDGLTSPHAGFYIVCKGDAKNPQVTDPLIGQTWAWRSKKEAIVFDSIEKGNSDYITKPMLISFYQKLGEKLVHDGKTHAVMCGTTSGISEDVGKVSSLLPIEKWKEYSGYSDSKTQKVIYDIRNPYLLYGVDDICTKETDRILEKIFESKVPLIDNLEFIKILNWAAADIHDDHESLLNALVLKIENLKQRFDRVDEYNHLITLVKNFCTNGLSPEFIEELKLHDPLNLLKRNGYYAPLTLAVEKHDFDLMKWIIANTTDKKILFEHNDSVLFKAIKKDIDVNIIKILIDNGANVNYEVNFPNTTISILNFALFHPFALQIISQMIENGADYNQKDMFGDNFILHAVTCENVEVVEKLLDLKVNVNSTNNAGQTALMKAILYGKNGCDMVKHLIVRGADVNIIDKEGQSALMLAMPKYSVEIAQELINAGADVNAIDKDGMTPLMYAMRSVNKGKRIETVKLLIDRKADLNVCNKNGNSALMLAIEANSEFAEMLIKAGADINVNRNGATPLIEAVKKGKLELVKFMLDYNPSLENLDAAITNTKSLSNSEISSLLIKKRDEVNSLKEKSDVIVLAPEMNNQTLIFSSKGQSLSDVNQNSKTNVPQAPVFGKETIVKDKDKKSKPNI